MKCKKLIVIAIITLLLILICTTTCKATTAIVNTDTLKLRKEASTDSTVLELLNQGQELDIIEQSGDWYKVKVNNMTGFVHKDYIKLNEEVANTNTQEPIVNEVTENIIPEDNNTINENTGANTNVEETKEFETREETLQNDVDIYILPLINSSKISNIKKDTKIIIMDEVKNWMYVQTNEVNGWICKNNIKTQTDSTTNNTTTNEIQETAIEEKVMYVNSPSIYVRSGPETTYQVVDSLILNAQVTVVAESGDWYKVKIGDVTGYIAKRLLSATSQNTTTRSADERTEETINENNQNVNTQVAQTTSKGEEIVTYAKQYLGCSYVYGGSGPSNFDCSGFTMYVFKNFGVSLSHSAIAQSKNGTYVAKEDLQPGDLVFFKDYETMNGIGHCGIYVGDGNFIHASSGTGYCVKISTLLSGSYNTRYETARRLI